MTRRIDHLATRIAHLVGPGRLHVTGGMLAFTPQGRSRMAPARIDPRSLDAVYCHGKVTLSDEAVRLIQRHGARIAWFSPNGLRCRGRMEPMTEAQTSAAARLAQFRALHHPPTCLELARGTVADKIHSQLAAARHYQRQGHAQAGPVVARLKRFHGELARASTLDAIRGLEGITSREWFALFATVLRPPWHFPGRVRRPPTDPVNALLSLGYTWLLNRAVTLTLAAGLEPQLGALHDYRPGRPSLACDLIEPLRAPAVDRWAIAVCNRKHLAPTDFRRDEASGGYYLQSRVFPATLQAWETHAHDQHLAEALEDRLEHLRRRFYTFLSPLPGPPDPNETTAIQAEPEVES
jgi:CRISPR-associated protein Cas1